MMTATINTDRINGALESLREAMVGKGMDASNIVRDELKQLTRTIVNFTPPLGEGGRVAGSKQAGEEAIDRELKNLMHQASPGFITEVSQRWRLNDVKGEVMGKDGQPLKLDFHFVDPTGSRLEELHRRHQNRRGKVPLRKGKKGTWFARVLVPIGVRDPYIKKLQTRVGRWKASWAFAASQAGAKFPAWIARHFGTLGTNAIADISRLADPVNPTVLFGSRCGGGNRTRYRVQGACTFRAKAMARRIKLILSDYNRDLSRGMRAEASAHKHREQELEVA